MKKVCLMLMLLSGVVFAETKQNDICKQQDLGGCETLFICQNGISFIVKYEKGTGTCNDIIISKYMIDTKEQKFIEVPNKK